jgi:hypothetical protein
VWPAASRKSPCWWRESAAYSSEPTAARPRRTPARSRRPARGRRPRRRRRRWPPAGTPPLSSRCRPRRRAVPPGRSSRHPRRPHPARSSGCRPRAPPRPRQPVTPVEQARVRALADREVVGLASQQVRGHGEPVVVLGVERGLGLRRGERVVGALPGALGVRRPGLPELHGPVSPPRDRRRGRRSVLVAGGRAVVLVVLVGLSTSATSGTSGFIPCCPGSSPIDRAQVVDASVSTCAGSPPGRRRPARRPLHDPAVDEHRVHVAALGLEGHVAVGVEDRERDRRRRRS